MTIIRKITATILLSIGMAGGASSSSVAPNATWQPYITIDPIPRFGLTADLPKKPVITDNAIYWLFGNSYRNGMAVHNNVLKLSLTDGNVSEVQPDAQYIAYNTTTLIDGRIFSFGGSSGDASYAKNTVTEYDPVSEGVITHDGSPKARFGSAIARNDDSIYMFGGWGFDTQNRRYASVNEDGSYGTKIDEIESWQNDIQVFDLSNEKWDVIEPLVTDIPFYDSAQIDEQVFFPLAESGYNRETNRLLSFSLATHESAYIELPETLYRVKIAATSTTLIVYGNPTDGLLNRSAWVGYIYSPSLDEWTEAPALPAAESIDEVFEIEVHKQYAYLIEYALDHSDSSAKQLYRLPLLDEKPSEPYSPSDSVIAYLFSEEDDMRLYVEETGTVANLVVTDEDAYTLLRSGESTNNSLKSFTQMALSSLDDQFDFVFYILDEDEVPPLPAPQAYHQGVKNDVQGIGLDLFDIGAAFGSAGKLQSIVVLNRRSDLIYGPSLHELSHRWGNYLQASLDSERHQEWLWGGQPQPYHWGYLSGGGQLGGWHDLDFSGSAPERDLYIFNDAREGLIGFSGLGPGNNSIKYSALEKYLMGYANASEVPDMLEPAVKPIETSFYPVYEVPQFNTITMDDVIDTHGSRLPTTADAQTHFSVLFVVVSKAPLTSSKWKNAQHYVSNFTRQESDSYLRLNNFYEATDGKGRLTVPNLLLQIDLSQIDSDGDGVVDADDSFPNNYYAAIDTDKDGMPDSFIAGCGDTQTCEALSGLTLDYDDDNDGVMDVDDQYPTNPYLSVSAAFKGLDFDNDGTSDIAFRRPSSGYFVILNSSTNAISRVRFGTQVSDQPIFADFDGDGVGDISIRRSNTGQFIYKSSQSGNIGGILFGTEETDIPVVADYDGDGVDDYAIRRPRLGYWFIKPSTTGEIERTYFGAYADDVPVPNDYDGDGKADIAVWRPGSGTWIIKRSSDGQLNRLFFGSESTDIPVAADYDGDGKADIAVRRGRTGFWYIKRSSDNLLERIYFGSSAEDIPVVADYDGDGKADIAIRRPYSGIWIIRLSSNNSYIRVYFGSFESDIPLAAPQSIISSMLESSIDSHVLDIDVDVDIDRDDVKIEILTPDEDWVSDKILSQKCLPIDRHCPF